jgi:hypothetical protein
MLEIETEKASIDLIWFPHGSMQAVTMYDIKEEHRGFRHKPLPG